MNSRIIKLQILVHKFCGYRDGRLCNKHRTLYHWRKRTKRLSYALGQRRASHNTVWYIRPYLHTSFHKLSLCQSQWKKPVYTYKHSCRISTAPRHPCCNRNTLVQLHWYTVSYRKLIHQKLCRFVDQIILIGGQIIKIGFYLNPRRLRFTDLQIIMKPDGLHDHLHFMIAILSSAQHIQPKIDLCQRF